MGQKGPSVSGERDQCMAGKQRKEDYDTEAKTSDQAIDDDAESKGMGGHQLHAGCSQVDVNLWELMGLSTRLASTEFGAFPFKFSLAVPLRTSLL